jgi:hypothetical protein
MCAAEKAIGEMANYMFITIIQATSDGEPIVMDTETQIRP